MMSLYQVDRQQEQRNMLATIIPLVARTFGTKNGNPIYNLAIYHLQCSSWL